MPLEDEFGDRMKSYERVETSRRLDPQLPIYARIDGRSFSSFTRGMDRPFDPRMIEAMVETTRYLVDETHARLGYTQSDEISLIWLAETEQSDVFFSGKVMKMASVLASMTAAKFARVCPTGFEARLPHFDCRVFQLPSKAEGANAFLWRAMDARKNAIQMVAQRHFSPKQLHGRGQQDMLAMLAEIGVEFEALPNSFKRGTFLQRETKPRDLSPEELSRIPEKHRPSGPVLRSSVEVLNLPPFNEIEDRVSVVFPLSLETSNDQGRRSFRADAGEFRRVHSDASDGSDCAPHRHFTVWDNATSRARVRRSKASPRGRQAMTETVSVPRDPTIEMISAAMDDLGWWVEPYTAPRESGVATDGDISAHDAAIINSQQMEVVASALKAALAVVPTPPQNADGEAVAWMTDDGRVVADHTKRTAMASTSKPAFHIPLVPASLLSTLKAERDALAKALEPFAFTGMSWRHGDKVQITVKVADIERARSTLKGDAP